MQVSPRLCSPCVSGAPHRASPLLAVVERGRGDAGPLPELVRPSWHRRRARPTPRRAPEHPGNPAETATGRGRGPVSAARRIEVAAGSGAIGRPASLLVLALLP